MSALHEFSVRYVTQRAEASLQCPMQLHIYFDLHFKQNYFTGGTKLCLVLQF